MHLRGTSRRPALPSVLSLLTRRTKQRIQLHKCFKFLLQNVAKEFQVHTEFLLIQSEERNLSYCSAWCFLTVNSGKRPSGTETRAEFQTEFCRRKKINCTKGSTINLRSRFNNQKVSFLFSNSTVFLILKSISTYLKQLALTF